jgi:hypothetical protein
MIVKPWGFYLADPLKNESASGNLILSTTKVADKTKLK